VTSIVLLGTLDSKGEEYDFVRREIEKRGADVTLVDAGILGEPTIEPDVTREEVAAAADVDLDELREAGDRGKAVTAMGEAATEVLVDLHEDGKVDGVMALGGSGGTSLATTAMRALPVAVPKLMVSTMASGNTQEYVGGTDVTMMYSVLDIAGLNSILRRILSNAAGAVVGMAEAEISVDEGERPRISMTQFGVTTPAADAAREYLEEQGYEVLVFHATGSGGQSMETLIADGFIDGVLDLTTTELADDLVGGIHSAGPDRLTAAGDAGVPQIVTLGALDMADFGPIDTVPEEYADRHLFEHSPEVTLMRTSPGECRQLGAEIAEKLNAARGPTELFVPLEGVSKMSVEGGPFHDPDADEALFEALREHVDPEAVTIHEYETDVNDAEFATDMAQRLHELVTETRDNPCCSNEPRFSNGSDRRSNRANRSSRRVPETALPRSGRRRAAPT